MLQNKLKAVVSMAVLYTFCTGVASATTYTWVPTVSGSWSTAANWSGGGGLAPTSGSATSLYFAGNTTYSASNNIQTNFLLNNITFNNSAGTVTLANSGSFYLDLVTNSGTTASINVNGAGNTLISSSMTYNSPTAININAGGSTATEILSNSFTLNSPLTVNVASGGGTLFLATAGSANTIFGTGSLNVNNLSGNKVFLPNMGGWTGALNINSGYAIGIDTTNKSDLISNSTLITVASGATYDFNGNAETMGGIAGAGNIVNTQAITLVLAGNQTFSGQLLGGSTLTQDVAGNLTLGGSNALSGLTATIGTITLANSSAAGVGTVTVGTSGALAFNTNGGTVTQFNLGGLSSTSTSSITLNDTSNFAANINVGSNNASTTISSPIIGLGAINKIGTGSLTVSNSINSYSGNTTITAGSILIGSAGTVATAGTQLGSGTINLAGGTLMPGGTGSRTLANPIVVVNGTSSTINDGNGDLILNGTITGGGTLNVGTASSASDSIWLQGDLSGFSGTVNFVDTAAGANFRLNSNATNASGVAFNLSGSTTGRALLWTTGALIDSTVQIGSLSGTAGVFGGTGTTTSPLGTVYQIGALNTSTTFSGVISGGNSPANVSITKVGSGMLTLGGANSYSGTTTISSGTLTSTNDSAVGPGAVILNPSSGSALMQFTSMNPVIGSLSNTGAGASLVSLGNLAGTPTLLTVGAQSVNTTFDGTIYDLSGQAAGAVGSLTKIGTGSTSTLGGSNSYTGGTTVAQGTLQLDFGQAGAPSTNIINPVSALTLGGGTTQFLTSAGLSNAQSFASLSVTPGYSSLQAIEVAGGTLTLGLGNSLTRNAGGLIDIALPTNGSLLTTAGSASSIITDANGVPYATVNGNDWAAKDPTNTRIVPASSLSGFYTPSTPTSLSGNVDVASGIDTTLATSSTANVIRFNNNEGRTLNLGSNTLAVGGILVTNNVATAGSNISGGTITAPANNEITVFQQSNQDFTISSVITDNGSPVSLTKGGSGNLNLAAANTFSGTATIAAGSVTLTNSAALGTATINYLGGNLSFGSFNTIALGNVMGSLPLSLTNATGGTVNAIVGSGNGNTTISAALVGAGGLTMVGSGNVTLTGVNTYTGGTYLQSGSLSFANASALPVNNSIYFNNGGALVYTGANTQGSESITMPLVFQGNGTFVVANSAAQYNFDTINWSGSGTFTKSGPGALFLGNTGGGPSGAIVVAQGIFGESSQRISHTLGMTVLSGGQFQVNDNAAGGNFTVGSGSLVLNGSGPNGTGAFEYTPQSDTAGAYCIILNPIVLQSNAAIGVINSASNVFGAVFDGSLSGTGNLTKVGNGYLSLAGSTTFPNNIDVEIGTPSGINAPSTLSIDGPFTVNGNSVTTIGNSAAFVNSQPFTMVGNSSMNVASSGSLTINGPFTMTDSATMTVASGGSLTVGPAGNLILSNTGLANVSNRISTTTPVTLGGILSLIGSNSAVLSQSLGAVTINGPASINASSTGGTASMTLTSLSSSASRGNLVIIGGNGTVNLTSTATSPLSAHGIITGNYAIVGNDWASYGASTASGYALVAASSSAYQYGNNPTVWAATDDVNVASALSSSITASQTINSLNFTNTNSLSINSGLTLSVASGGILASSNATISGGSLVGSEASNQNLRFVVRGATNTLTVSSVIANTGTQSVTVAGEGTVTFGAANVFTGGLTISGATVDYSTVANLGATGGTITLEQNATLQYTGAANLGMGANHPLVLQGSGTFSIPNPNVTVTFSTTNFGGVGTLTKTGPGELGLGSAGSGPNGSIVIAQGVMEETSQRIPNIKDLTVLSGGAWEIYDNATNGANFGFGTGVVVTLNGPGGNGSGGALIFTPQSATGNYYESVGSNIVLASDSGIAVNNTTTGTTDKLQLNGNISGPGALIKTTNTLAANSDGEIADYGNCFGILSLAGSNTYAGNTIINAGSILLASSTALPSTTVMSIDGSNSSTLDLGGFSTAVAGLNDGLHGGGTITNSGVEAKLTVSGSGSFSGVINNVGGTIDLYKTGSGALVLNGANTYAGATTINGGTLQIGNGGSGASIGSTTSIANSAALVFNHSDTQVLTAPISGSGSLTHTGAGTLFLDSNSNYTGQTTVSGGQLIVGINDSGASIGSTSGVVLANGATFGFFHTDNVAFSQSISGSGNLFHTGVGSLALFGNNTYSGATTIDGGTVSLQSSTALPMNTALVVDSNNSAALDVVGNNIMLSSLNNGPDGGGTITNSGTNSATVVVNGGGNFSGTLADGLSTLAMTVSGSTPLILGGTNTYSGQTTIIHNGLLVAANANVLSPSSAVLLNSGTLNLTQGPQTIPSLSISNSGVLSLGVGNLLTVMSPSTLSGGTLNLFGSTGGSAELISYPSGFIGTFGSVSTPSGYSLVYSYSTDQIDLFKNPVTGPYTWFAAGGGSWINGNNWNYGNSPSGKGVPVVMGMAATTPATVTLDGAQTVGTLTFNNAADYTLIPGNSGTLTLDNTGGSGAAQILVSSGSQTISAPLTLANTSSLITLNSGGTLSIGASVLNGSGSSALTLNGDGTGTLILSGSNTFAGGTTVSNGALVLEGASSLLAGTSLTIGGAAPGAAFAMPLAVSPASSSAPATSLAPVPEPGTFVLLAMAAIVGLGLKLRAADA